MKKRMVALIAALSLAFTVLAVFPSAPVIDTAVADMGIMASECIRSYAITVVPKSGRVIEAGVSVSCYNTASSLGFTSFAIQEQQSDGTWKNVKSSSNDLVSNSLSHSASLSYTGTAGKLYRATATIKCVYNGTTEYRYPSTSGYAAKN